MNNGKTIFSQIMSNIPEREFKACVDRYKGNYRSRNFSTISLCLKLCPWAKFRKHKGCIKMHTLLDLRGNLPLSVYLTEASVHDVKALDYLYIEPSAIYLKDKGYVDFYRLFHLIHEKNAHSS